MDTISSRNKSWITARGTRIDWQSAHGMTLVCGVVFFAATICSAVLLTSLELYGSAIVTWVVNLILAALFSWVRYENQRVGKEERVRGMKIEEVLSIVDWILVFLLFTTPIAFHFSIGMSEIIGDLAWTIVSPAYMIKMAITERNGEDDPHRRRLRQQKVCSDCSAHLVRALLFSLSETFRVSPLLFYAMFSHTSHRRSCFESKAATS